MDMNCSDVYELAGYEINGINTQNGHKLGNSRCAMNIDSKVGGRVIASFY